MADDPAAISSSTAASSSRPSSSLRHRPNAPPPPDDFSAPLAEAAALLMGDPTTATTATTTATTSADHPHHHHQHHHHHQGGSSGAPGAVGGALQGQYPFPPPHAAQSSHHLPPHPHHHNNNTSNNNSNNNNTTNANNKWNKNGYGNAVQKQSGKFSRAESELVRRAVEEYCHAKQIPTSKLCSECDHKAEFKGAWMEIAKRLPHRSVQSVYRHGIRQLHPFKRGAWSDEECHWLAEHVQKLGKKWSTIQAKLNRSADSCRDKYREMSEEFVKGRWKEHDTEMLKRVIREQLNVSPDMDMKEVGRWVEEQGIQISWSVVSKRMGHRSRLSCFKKWQKLSGVTGNLIGEVDLDGDPQPHGLHPHHHDAAHLKRGRGTGEDDDDDEEDGDDDDDVDFSGLHPNHHHHHHHHLPSLAGVAPPSKRGKVAEKIEFPQAATAGAAAALAHQHQHQLQPFAHHHPQAHEGMDVTGLHPQESHPHHQHQQPHLHPLPPSTPHNMGTTKAAPPSAAFPSGAAAAASAPTNPFRNVVQHSNEMLFDASQAEAIMEAVKLPDPGRLK